MIPPPATTYRTTIVTGWLIFAIGLIAVIFPIAIGKITTIIIGIILIGGGVLRLSFSIFSFTAGSRVLRYAFGILMIIAGVWMISNPKMGLNILTLLLAIYFIIDGISSIVFSFSFMPVSGGAYLLFNGIIASILGVLIWIGWPASGNYALGIYVGIKLLFDGMALIMTGKFLKRTSL